MATLHRQGRLAETYDALPPDAQRFMLARFPLWGRLSQRLGEEGAWTTWLLLGGRGSGKTRVGAEWVRSIVHGDPAHTKRPVKRIALVGETYADAREVMIEGQSGILSVCEGAERPD